MEIWAILFVLILLGVAILLIKEVRPYEVRKIVREEDPLREAHHAQLKEAHRMRRQRDRVWFRIDDLYTEFVRKTSGERPALVEKGTPAGPQAGNGEAAADSWNEVTLAYIKDKYESFLRK